METVQELEKKIESLNKIIDEETTPLPTLIKTMREKVKARKKLKEALNGTDTGRIK